MNELEEQKKELRVALAAAKLKEDLGLKKEHIVKWDGIDGQVWQITNSIFNSFTLCRSF